MQSDGTARKDPKQTDYSTSSVHGTIQPVNVKIKVSEIETSSTPASHATMELVKSPVIKAPIPNVVKQGNISQKATSQKSEAAQTTRDIKEEKLTTIEESKSQQSFSGPTSEITFLRSEELGSQSLSSHKDNTISDNYSSKQSASNGNTTEVKRTIRHSKETPSQITDLAFERTVTDSEQTPKKQRNFVAIQPSKKPHQNLVAASPNHGHAMSESTKDTKTLPKDGVNHLESGVFNASCVTKEPKKRNKDSGRSPKLAAESPLSNSLQQGAVLGLKSGGISTTLSALSKKTDAKIEEVKITKTLSNNHETGHIKGTNNQVCLENGSRLHVFSTESCSKDESSLNKCNTTSTVINGTTKSDLITALVIQFLNGLWRPELAYR